MTKKELIIKNGVNVAECRHYNTSCYYECDETSTIDGGIVCEKCEDKSFCYYKNWKRAEAQAQSSKGIITSNGKLINKLLAENEQLKSENEQLKGYYEEFLKWLLKQQYYILHPNIKKKIKALLKNEKCEDIK